MDSHTDNNYYWGECILCMEMFHIARLLSIEKMRFCCCLPGETIDNFMTILEATTLIGQIYTPIKFD